MKTCSTCGATKSSGQMKRDKRYADGIAPMCKACHNANRHITPERRQRKSKAIKESWPAGHRPCLTCGEMLPFERFGKNRNLWMGIHNHCKECRKPMSKAYYNKWVDQNREQRLLSSAKSRAKRKGLPFNLELEDIVIPERCPVLGIELDTDGGKWKDSTPSLDRMVPDKGYVKGNIAVISWKANWLKRDASLQELESLVRWMRQAA